MPLSKELISQFAKITKGTEDKKETIVYGTVAENGGSKYVRLDGSDILMPAYTTVEVSSGERVTVMIKNHTAVITGNITSPAARSEDLKTVGSSVTGIYRSNEGLVLSYSVDEETSYNVLVGSSKIDIRKGDIILASLSKDNLDIGTSNSTTNIYGKNLHYYIDGIVYKPYYSSGDSINVEWYGAGFVSNSSGSVYFSIPLSKPVIGCSNVSAESINGLIVRQSSVFVYGSSESSYAIPVSYSCSLSGDGGIVNVIATFGNTTNAQNEASCGVAASIKFTFT